MYKHFFKRLFDIITSIIVFPVFILILIIIGPIIYFNDKGNVFYVSKRLGKNGKAFKMIKFRSMKINAHDIRNEDGSTYSSDNDQRITKIGKILRKTSIDELPQIINVLLGHMSLIGPRPTMGDVKIEEYKDKFKERFKLRPGITGYSQAYFRNSITQDAIFENDVFYCNNYSFLFDIKIFLKTIQAVLFRKNIYKNKKENKYD